jgi:hypothetical protein
MAGQSRSRTVLSAIGASRPLSVIGDCQVWASQNNANFPTNKRWRSMDYTRIHVLRFIHGMPVPREEGFQIFRRIARQILL